MLMCIFNIMLPRNVTSYQSLSVLHRIIDIFILLNTQLILGEECVFVGGGGISVIQKTFNSLQSRKKVPSIKKMLRCFL